MNQPRSSPGGSRDFADAEARWGAPSGASPWRVSDLWRLPLRVPFALALARAAATDPGAFRLTAMAVRRHGALQKPLELFEYLHFLRGRRPANILEIGTLWGGLFYAHCGAAAPGGHVIAIDSFPREAGDRMTARFEGLARPGQRVTCLWRDSHEDATARQLDAALDGSSLDLLFLDGDHSFEGARQDYETYASHVRPGGLIALHDIDASDAGGMSRLWQMLKRDHESLSFVDRANAPQGLGIGVIVTR